MLGPRRHVTLEMSSTDHLSPYQSWKAIPDSYNFNVLFLCAANP